MRTPRLGKDPEAGKSCGHSERFERGQSKGRLDRVEEQLRGDPSAHSSPLLPAPETAASTPGPGECRGPAWWGSLVVAKRAPTPTRAHPLTMRACKSALITSSISLQLQTRNGETAHPAPGLGEGGVRQGPGPWGPGLTHRGARRRRAPPSGSHGGVAALREDAQREVGLVARAGGARHHQVVAGEQAAAAAHVAAGAEARAVGAQQPPQERAAVRGVPEAQQLGGGDAWP